MGYQFFNMWPYSYTYFPTMIDHIDPVNHIYFTGLHEAIQTIQYYLGIHPQGSFMDVAHRLNYYDSIIQNFEQYIGYEAPSVEEDAGIFDSFIETRISTEKGACYVGFSYYDKIYTGPCERDEGNRSIIWFNTADESHGYQEVPGWGYQSRGAIVIGNIAYISHVGSTAQIGKFNIDTWAQSNIMLGGGSEYPGRLIELGDYLYTPCYQSPGKIARIKKSDDSITLYNLDSGYNEPREICTDGTLIYITCNTDPVKLVIFNPATGTHENLTLAGYHNEVHYSQVILGYLYLFNSYGTTQIYKMNIASRTHFTLEPAWPGSVQSGNYVDPYIYLYAYNGGDIKLIFYNPLANISYVSTGQGNRGYGYNLAVNGNYIHCGGTMSPNHNYIGQIVIP